MESKKPNKIIQRRAMSLFEFGLPSPPWMAYTFGKNEDSRLGTLCKK